MPGALQNHVHEARAPEPAAAGGIATDVAPCFGDDIRPEAPARKSGFVRIRARRVTVPVMVIPVVPASVMMMFVVMTVCVMS